MEMIFANFPEGKAKGVEAAEKLIVVNHRFATFELWMVI
jgi:hypothetical protein